MLFKTLKLNMHVKNFQKITGSLEIICKPSKLVVSYLTFMLNATTSMLIAHLQESQLSLSGKRY